MPFCPNCGTKIAPDAKICRVCGKEINLTNQIKTNKYCRNDAYSNSDKIKKVLFMNKVEDKQ